MASCSPQHQASELIAQTCILIFLFIRVTACGMAHENSDGKSFWDVTDVPEKDNEDFMKLVCTGKRTPSFQPEAAHVSAWHSAPNRETYSSFGDQGTTASVNAYGEILQFSTYIGAGKSGMFSVDHGIMDEPYFVKPRAQKLDA
ncbi:hypothetical protein BDV96DRAFT_692587 [Lophiotrema nucula]|uniref:Uncharacterized protein n=1 Tax=Lophiotrema nucula TaxID=690887 RepID=A0A6A5YQT6_9PLEO|nr:hypothetical protein BDV96DRAFT_692587 [Lophiotrema nucula]